MVGAAFCSVNPRRMSWSACCLLKLLLAVGMLRVGIQTSLADPDDLPGGQPEAFTASGFVTGTLLPGVDETVIFAALGDYGVAGSSLEGISGMIRGWNPDFIISTGDNTYGVLDSNADSDPVSSGKQNAWEFNIGNYFGAFIKARTDDKFPLQRSSLQRFFPSVGNHDSAPDASNGGTIEDYLDYFHEDPGGTGRLPQDRGAVHNPAVSYYVVQRGPLDLFMLDADVPNRPDLIADQKLWLTTQVANSTARWKIGVFHQPPLTSGFRAAAAWMAWPELKVLDAILCGHDHFYERLDYFGVPLFITGAGGQFLYNFRNPPDANSLVRYNAHHSAMRIVADRSSLTLESRAFELPARQENLVESFVLGTPAPVDNEDSYRFFAEAGETIQLKTSTPPPLHHPPLGPTLALFTPGGVSVQANPIPSPDGRNVVLSHQAAATGYWQVKVSALPPGRGQYTLNLTTVSPVPPYQVWQTRLPAGQSDAMQDPDQDGLSNLLEYALLCDPNAISPAVGGAWQGQRLERDTTGITTTTFDLPSPLPPGISYQVETHTQPGNGPWTVLAWRATASDWQGAPGVTVQTGSPLPDARRIAVTLAENTPRRFFRLSVTRND